MAVKISGTEKGSPAQRYGLKGCTLLSIDGHEINDMLDYEFYSSGEDEGRRAVLPFRSEKRI